MMRAGTKKDVDMVEFKRQLAADRRGLNTIPKRSESTQVFSSTPANDPMQSPFVKKNQQKRTDSLNRSVNFSCRDLNQLAIPELKLDLIQE